MDKLQEKVYGLLRKSESYFKTDMVYLASGGFWLTIGQIISAVASFLLAIAFANLIPKETYGTYQYILSIASLLTIPTLSGIDTALKRAVAQGREGAFFPALYTKIRWGLLGGITSVALSGYYYWNGDHTLTIAFLVTAIFLPFMDALSLYGSILEGRKLFKESALTGITLGVARVAVLIAVLFSTQNVLLILFAYYIVTSTLRCILLIAVIKKLKPQGETDDSVISFGKHLSLMGIVGAVANQADKVLLWHFLGAASLATYSLALAPVARIQTAFKTLESLAFPKFASSQKERIKKTLPRKLFMLRALLIVPVLSYVVAAPYLYEWLFPQYMESVPYSQILAIVLFFLPQKITGVAITAHAHKKALYVTSTVSPIAKLVALAVLVPYYGILGVVIAFLVPYIANAFILSFYLKRL